MWKQCPGKVLICGGHLILDPAEKGISFPFPAACISSKANRSCLQSAMVEMNALRLFATVSLSFYEEGKEKQVAVDLRSFSVISIFRDIQFSPSNTMTLNAYMLQINSQSILVRKGSAIVPLPCASTELPTHLQICLSDPLSFEQLSFQATTIMTWFIANCENLRPHDDNIRTQNCVLLEIETISDAAFYITPPCGFSGKCKIPVWNQPIKKLCKSGLGSSAAYVSSLILALSEDNCDPDSQLAQAILAHWIGQGCKGSGFDICTSILNAQEKHPVCLIFSQSKRVSELLPILANAIRPLCASVGAFSLLKSQFSALVEVVLSHLSLGH